MTAAISCQQALERLWDYLDGELGDHDHRAVSEHLAFCLRCCGELAFARELQGLLARSGTQELPDDVERRLVSLIDELVPIDDPEETP